jgi:hypothetical protein
MIDPDRYFSAPKEKEVRNELGVRWTRRQTRWQRLEGGCMLYRLPRREQGETARDEQPWAGRAPPGIAYVYAPDRKHARPAEHLAGRSGSPQVDGYGAYAELAQRGDVAIPGDDRRVDPGVIAIF